MKKTIIFALCIFIYQNILPMNRNTIQKFHCVPTQTILNYADTINKLTSVGIFCIDIDQIFALVHKNKTPNIVELVKQSGLVHKKGFDGKTPLENALEQDKLAYKDVVEILIAAGAQQENKQ